VAAGLPTGFPGAILVVVHVPAGGGRALAGILERAGPLPAVHAVDRDLLRERSQHLNDKLFETAEHLSRAGELR
jgi:chemotaxis response regulator CheB